MTGFEFIIAPVFTLWLLLTVRSSCRHNIKTRRLIELIVLVSWLLLLGYVGYVYRKTSPLVIAIRADNDQSVTDLLKRDGSLAFTRGISGVAPLELAASICAVRSASVLVEYGADVDSVGFFTAPPLFRASISGCTGIVTLLLESGADVNIKGGSTRVTPLVTATLNGHTEIVRILLEHGADPYFTDMNGMTARDHAVMRGYPGIATMIDEHTPTWMRIESEHLKSSMGMRHLGLEEQEGGN